jgi:acetyl-CoA decarbonylase/synthase complex subunit delta
MPNVPKIAMEVWDYDPSQEWPRSALAPFADVVASPGEWAKKCVEEYGAEMIALQLKSTDPNGMDRSAEDALKTVKAVLDAVSTPVAVWGTANNQKDEEVLKKIAESFEGKNICLAPVEEGCYKGVGASALGYGHTVVASSPIDVNLAKQLNILLGNLGLPLNRIVIDPTTGGLGYGLEYTYSVMERIRMAALTQEDDTLQCPIICNVGNEVWKCKEAGLALEEAPTLGDLEKRGVLMEAVSSVCYLLSGADVVVLRHPESVRLTREYIRLMGEGGEAGEVEPISKLLEEEAVDLLSISPEPDLSMPEKEVKAPAKPKAEKPAAPPAPEAEKKVVELRPKEEPEAKVEAPPKAEQEAEEKPKAEEAAKRKAEEEARAKAEEEARKKAEEEAKAKAEEEARKKAEEEAKAAAARAKEQEAQRIAEAKEKEKEDLQELRYKRAKAREKAEEERKVAEDQALPKTPAAVQMDMVEKLIGNLDRIHRR